ncbi:MAG TPA: right-handed parallel beta-helix repeat-containing protein [bacterium]|nr:right-handed parallel beta-helix repeat-containing protein [bacterium]
MRRILAFCWAVVLAFAVLSTGLASASTTYYVNSTIGDDTNDGSRSAPWKTISHSLANIGGADPSRPARLSIASGNYSSSANGETFPLEVRSYVTMVGMGPESTVLDAGLSAPHVIFVQNAQSVTIERIALTQGAATGDWPDACGGGICAINSDITVRSCKIYSNSATVVDKHGAGAGVYLYGDCSPLIEDCQFVLNTATAGGAGICCEYYCSPTVINTTFDRNTGAAIYAFRWSDVKVNNCSFTENTGGMILEDFSTAHVEASSISRNSADSGAAINCLHHCQITLESCTLWSNVATGSGGAILCERDGRCNITDCELSLNTSGQDGGAICCVGSTLQLLDSDVTANSARGQGGGVFCGQDSEATIDETNIAGNDAAWGAGVAFSDNTGGNITSCNFTKNSASSGGAAVFCQNYSSPNLLHCRIMDNVVAGDAPLGGAGLYCEYCCDPNLNNCLVARNDSQVPGAGIYSNEYCSPTLTNVTVWDNTAASSATSIFCDSYSELSLLSCIVWGGEDGIATLGESEVQASYSCVFGGYSGPGTNNIDQNPRFASASDARGDYYLSAEAAKQKEDSPCINAGFGFIENASGGLSFRTTRTDDGFDADEVDMGYHYLTSIADIKCYLNASQYRVGDTFDLSIRIANPSDESTTADAYIAIVSPTGQIFCVGDTAFGPGLFPWVAGFEMPGDYLFGPASVLAFQVPQGCPVGTYLAAAALFIPGSMTQMSEMSLVGFEMLD